METTIKPLYFTSKTYGVCKVLKPKLLEAVQENSSEGYNGEEN
ncbi:hypothetical protein [Muricauda amoyensis]|nr:hypothetical protein [Allomuricauda amoyensis]